MFDRELLTKKEVLKDFHANILPEKVIQFGDGRFLRGFADWLIDEANDKGYFMGSIVVIKNRKLGNSIELLNRQGGLFTLVMMGLQNGREIKKTKVISSVKKGINPFIQEKEFLVCSENPNLRFVISNTTEVGLNYKKEKSGIGIKENYPANLTIFLYQRFKHFNGDPNRGLIVLPTELVEDNGTKLKETVLMHAKDWSLPHAFIEWLNKNNYFLNTLVDRIVTKCSDELKMEIYEHYGYHDELIVSCEPYHLWAIEGPARLEREFPLAKAGLNVYWQDDIKSFRLLKLHILNGSHTLLAPIAYLMKQKTVKESLQNQLMYNFVDLVIHNEIIPALNIPPENSIQFAKTVIERFKNPFIFHFWEDILMGTVAKFTLRLLPILEKNITNYKRLPKGILFSMAALLLLYRNEIREEKEEKTVSIFFEDIWRDEYKKSIENIVQRALENRNIWGYDLTKNLGLVEKVASAVRAIKRKGVKEALFDVVNNYKS